MNDEIKEILNRFNFIKKEPDKLSYYPEDLLSREDMWLLLDYITNLQEENEKLKEDLIGQENLALGFSKTSHEYYQRIEKAIEYIEHNTFQDSDGGWIFTFYEGKEMLLDILNGRSDE